MLEVRCKVIGESNWKSQGEVKEARPGDKSQLAVFNWTLVTSSSCSLLSLVCPFLNPPPSLHPLC